MPNDLPRKGPSGTYSQAWRSRADQSLSPTTPKTWSAKSSTPTRSPSREPGADDEAELGLDVEPGARAVGRRRLVGRLALAARAHDLGAAGHDGATAAVVADGQVPPVRQQRLLVGAEDPADVGGVLERGVEVDVVADGHGQVELDVVQRQQVRLDEVALGLVGEQAGQPAAQALAHRAPLGHQRVERRLLEGLVGVEHLGGRDGGEVEHQVADPHPDPRVLAGQREHAVGQVVDVEEGAGGALHPGGGHESSSSPVATSVSSGSVTEQEPNDVNHRRPAVQVGVDRAGDRGVVPGLVEDRHHLLASGALEGLPRWRSAR